MGKTTAQLVLEILELDGWSQVKLASAIGVTQPTIHRILNGQADCKASTAAAISQLHQSVIDSSVKPSE
jgi:plasmid maintenance system antidote protein VapI